MKTKLIPLLSAIHFFAKKREARQSNENQLTRMMNKHIKLINSLAVSFFATSYFAIRYFASALLIYGLAMPTSFAAAHEDGNNKSHEQKHSHNHHSGLHAHVHGEAELTLVIEKQRLHMNLTAPAESLLGFEHQANTQHEKNMVKQAVKHLSTLNHVINFKTTNCQLTEQNVDTSSVMPDTLTREQSTHAQHAEISASYGFSCQHPEQITAMSIELFRHFERLTKIHSIWLTERQQGSQVLTPSSPVLNLR